MREIVHIQAGQCGNQIGAKVGCIHAPAMGGEGRTFSSSCSCCPHTYSRSTTKEKKGFFLHFLLLLLWITDLYLNSGWNLHQTDQEKYARDLEESHNDFYLHRGTETKHLGFGTAAIHSSLTGNPERKNKPRLVQWTDEPRLSFVYYSRETSISTQDP